MTTDAGCGLATGGRSWIVPTEQVAVTLAALAWDGPRWLWWRARDCRLLPLRPRTCWDLGAVHQVLHGGRRNDPAAVWAAAHGLAQPEEPGGELALFDRGGRALEGDPADPVRADGTLRPEWTAGPPPDPARWAALALDVQTRQEAALRALPDPRPRPLDPPLALLTAYAESAAALLAVELEHDGLPVDRAVAEALVGAQLGPRPGSTRQVRDAPVLALLPTDLRNPALVRAALLRLGIDVPDTRSWRLEAYRGAHPAVEALLAWRKVERTATTYGYGWLDTQVSADGRLRGAWTSADGGAGRMTALAGLHSLPAELRPAVVAEAGHVLVRADLGQVEPRVLAAVSGDSGLAGAAKADDMYTPVADALRCDRPTAKVAVLAAMYGQTSGAAGRALEQMERAYPIALAFLRTAEQAGREGRDVRTHGGRLVRVGSGGAGRFARNAVVQGAAAELFKAWAASVRTGLGADGGRIVLCLHDELLLHVPLARADAAARLLHAALAETAARWASGCGVRFVAEVAVMARWSDAKA